MTFNRKRKRRKKTSKSIGMMAFDDEEDIDMINDASNKAVKCLHSVLLKDKNGWNILDVYNSQKKKMKKKKITKRKRNVRKVKQRMDRNDTDNIAGETQYDSEGINNDGILYSNEYLNQLKTQQNIAEIVSQENDNNNNYASLDKKMEDEIEDAKVKRMLAHNDIIDVERFGINWKDNDKNVKMINVNDEDYIEFERSLMDKTGFRIQNNKGSKDNPVILTNDRERDPEWNIVDDDRMVDLNDINNLIDDDIKGCEVDFKSTEGFYITEQETMKQVSQISVNVDEMKETCKAQLNKYNFFQGLRDASSCVINVLNDKAPKIDKYIKIKNEILSENYGKYIGLLKEYDIKLYQQIFVDNLTSIDKDSEVILKKNIENLMNDKDIALNKIYDEINGELFEDIKPEHRSFDILIQKWMHMKRNYNPEYKCAFISKAVPNIVKPFIDKELICWNLLGIKINKNMDIDMDMNDDIMTENERFIDMNWYTKMTTYGVDINGEIDKSDDDDSIVPRLIAKVVIPHIIDIIKHEYILWDNKQTEIIYNEIKIIKAHVDSYKDFEAPFKTIIQCLMDKFSQYMDDYAYINKDKNKTFPTKPLNNNLSNPLMYQFILDRTIKCVHILNNFTKYYEYFSSNDANTWIQNIYSQYIKEFLTYLTQFCINDLKISKEIQKNAFNDFNTITSTLKLSISNKNINSIQNHIQQTTHVMNTFFMNSHS